MKYTLKLAMLIIAALFVAGCATTQSDIDVANDYCANNGGVTHIQIKYNNTVRITCGNTAKFTFTSEGSTND